MDIATIPVVPDAAAPAHRSSSFRGSVAPLVLLAALVVVFLHAALVPPAGTMLAALDARALFYPWLTTWRESVLHGRLPLWDPAYFSGMPFLANPQVAAWYPPTWLALVFPVSVTLSLHTALHLWLAGAGMFVLARQLFDDRGAALAAAVTFTFSGFMAARVYGGHLGVLAVYAWAPCLLAATTWAVRRGGTAHAMVAGIPLGLAILAGHVSSLLYLGVIWTGFAVTLVGRDGYGAARVARQVAIAGVVGAALAAVQLLPFVELAWHSTRLGEVAHGPLAMPFSHFITLLVPDFFGDPIRMHYWSTPNFEEFFYGTGLLPLLALPLAWRIRPPLARYCLVLMAAGLVLSPGPRSPAYSAVATALPVIALDRAPARAMVLFTCGSCLLLAGVLADTRRHDGDTATRRRLLVRAAAVVTILAFAGALYSALTLLNPASPSVGVMRSIRLLGWVRVVAATLALSATWYWMMGGRRSRLALSLLLALIVADLWSFGLRLVRVETTEPAAVWRDAAAIIHEPHARVLPWRLEFQHENDGLLVGLTSTSGYNTLELASYRAAIAGADPQAAIYDVAAARYVVSGPPLQPAAEGGGTLRLLGHTASTWVYERSRALDQVRLVHELEVIPSSEGAHARLAEPSFRPDRTAIVADAAGCRPGPIPTTPSQAIVRGRSDVGWEIDTHSRAEALLIIAENAYPGWEVAIDGVSAVPLLIHGTFKGVCVPAGDHTVVWRFRPLSLLVGGAVSLVTILGIAVAAARSRAGA